MARLSRDGYSMTKWHQEFQARDGRYGIETVEELLELLCCGESLDAICKLDGMPSRETVSRWMEELPILAKEITSAELDGDINKVLWQAALVASDLG
jgi:hypothetical protein